MSSSQIPSEILKDLSAKNEPKDFLALLQKDVFPFLDRLSAKEKSKLIALLTKTAEENSGVAEISYASTEKSLKSGVAALKRHVKSDWKDGYDEQAEMMIEICGEVGDWLQVLWTVGIEKGRELKLVHKSLKLCKTTIDAISSTNSRSEFSDLETPEIVIKDASGKVVYEEEYGTAENAILWVWRELLLSTVVHAPTPRQRLTLAKTFIADIEKLKIDDEMLSRLDDVIAPPPKPTVKDKKPGEFNMRDWDAEEKNRLRMNAHWSQETRAAVPEVKALLASSQIAAFEGRPNCIQYDSLVAAKPDCKDRLLEITRAHLFTAPSSKGATLSKSEMIQGFQIFRAANSGNDLLSLLDIAMKGGLWKDDYSIITSLKYLGTCEPTIRSKAIVPLRSGLYSALGPIKTALHTSFLELDTAWEYLASQLKAKKITARASARDDQPPPSKRPKYDNGGHSLCGANGVYPHIPDAQRDPVFKVFCDKAGWNVDDGNHPSESEFKRGYDSDGNSIESDQDMDRDRPVPGEIETDVISALQRWVAVLNEWPDAAERDALKKEIRESWSQDKERLFFTVDGVADALARRCDFGSKPCRQKLGRGLRELYVSFAEDGPEVENVKFNMPPNLGFRVVSGWFSRQFMLH